MLLKELTTMDEHGAFRSDVQLSDYENKPLNLELLRNYIFTIHAPATQGGAQRDYSAKDVLDQLKTAFISDHVENRIVLTANYGRGKSHLALTLANFFARPVESDEIKTIQQRLGQAINNPGQLSGYMDFKKTKGEFLVIRLRGDSIDDLQEGFLNALEQALSEHSATHDIKMSFWHEAARKWFQELDADGKKKAQAYLATQNTDMESLLHDLRKVNAYDIVRETFKQVTKAYPNFGREVNLKDIVLWAVDEVCVKHKLGGLLVLFDEFSLFLQKYTHSRTPGKLQELLNGISDRQGKSAFLAFTQQDVDTVNETYAEGQRRYDVKKELDRLPKDKRARLFSLMESVLNVYLKQDKHAWENWIKNPPIRSAFIRSREILATYFKKRYEDLLKWSSETLEATVVCGCFPMHPLTIAILSTHTFESGAGDNPRTALHFVRQMWEDKHDQAASRDDGQPNFVFAITLVDFFGQQISERWYSAYQHALGNSTIQIDDEYKDVLKALLLQQAVLEFDSKKPRLGDQIELLGNLSGLDEKKIKKILEELKNARVVQSDPISRSYSLFPAGARSSETDKIIYDATNRIEINLDFLQNIARDIPKVNVKLDFGNSEDWSPCNYVFTSDTFTTDDLDNVIQHYRAEPYGIKDTPRGIVVWLLAQTEDEKTKLHQVASATLDAVLEKYKQHLPVVVILPRQATPGLVSSARRYMALGRLTSSDREKTGKTIYDQERDHSYRQFKEALIDFVGDTDGRYMEIKRNDRDYALPGAYRAMIQTLKDKSLGSVLLECYKKSYAFRVDFSDKPVASKGINHLRTAVREISLWLLNNDAYSGMRNLSSKNMSDAITRNYMIAKWGLLEADTYKIQPPSLMSLREAWNLLEETFPRGGKEKRVRDVLIELLNPPYGHDYNTLTLLLMAWIGFHRHNIILAVNSQIVSHESFKKYFDGKKSPQEFIGQICSTEVLSIKRNNPDEAFAKVNQLIEQIYGKTSFKIDQCAGVLAELDQALANPALPPPTQTAIQEVRPHLEQAIEKARSYDIWVSQWLSQMPTAELEQLLKIPTQLDSLPDMPLVVPNQLGIAELRQRLEKQIESHVESLCRRYAVLADIGDYRSYHNKLEAALTKLKQYPVLQNSVEEALARLDTRHEELKRLDGEKTIVAEINGMVESVDLANLYNYRMRLEEFSDLSSQTDTLRRAKLAKIEGRIKEFEQLPDQLKPMVDGATTQQFLAQAKTTLMSRLERTKNTPLHAPLDALYQRIERLETWFSDLRELSNHPLRSPADTEARMSRLSQLETEAADVLGQAQKNLIAQKRQEVDSYRQQEIDKAQKWLNDFTIRSKAEEEDAETLLKVLQSPPAFLSEQDILRLEQIRPVLQTRLADNKIAHIENVFQQLDREARLNCLNRLQKLV